jgi:AraC-like DNA-binding protein
LKWENLSYDNWEKDILNTYYYKEFLPETKIVSGDKHLKKVIPYISAIPLNAKGYAKGSIMAFLDLDKIKNILNKINKADQGITYIFDRKNQKITSVGSLDKDVDIISLVNNERANIQIKKIGNIDYFITQNTSVLTGLKIISILPTSYVSDQLSYIKNIGILVLIITLISGFFLALYVSYKRTKPIIEIAEIAKVNISGCTNKINTIDLIRENLTSIIEDNKDLNNYKEKQIEQNRNLFIERLLNGNLSSNINFGKQLELFGIDDKSSYYNIMIINILGYEDLENEELLIEKDLIKLIIRKYLEDIKEIEGILYMHSNNQLIFILTKDILDKQEVIQTFLIEKLCKEKNIKVIVSLGTPCNDLSNISFSFGQANYAMQYLKKNMPINFIAYSQLKDFKEMIYYPLEIENKIIQLTLQGYYNQVESLCALIYEENFKNKNLSNQIKMQLVSNFLGTLNRIIIRDEREISLFEIHQKLKGLYTVEEKINFVCDNIIKIAKENHKKIEDSDKLLVDKFVEFIENNYSDSTLNICVVANELNYKETFIYHFFINNMQISFASYLEKIRMEKAKKLLMKNNLSINEIASQCGYSSPHSFRRAFKRITSITPSEYKN